MESTLLILVVPLLSRPSRRRKRLIRSSSPALGGKGLLPPSVVSSRTTIEDPPGTEGPMECEGSRLESSTWIGDGVEEIAFLASLPSLEG